MGGTRNPAAYNESGQKTDQAVSWFGWWLAIKDGRVLSDYPAVLRAAEEDGELHIIGETTIGRRFNGPLPADKTAGAIAAVTLPEGAQTRLYPNNQVKETAAVIQNFWITDRSNGKRIEPIFDENGEFRAANLLGLYGHWQDGREVNEEVTVNTIIQINDNPCWFAVGDGQRYLLRQPADRATIQAWQAKQKVAIAATS